MAMSPSIDYLRSTGVDAMKIRTAGEIVITAYNAAARARR
jgi:hypothetical protein